MCRHEDDGIYREKLRVAGGTLVPSIGFSNRYYSSPISSMKVPPAAFDSTTLISSSEGTNRLITHALPCYGLAVPL